MNKFFSLIFGAILTISAAYADTTTFYTYGTVQAMDGYPMIGTGLRLTNGAHNLDLLGSVLPINKFDEIVFHTKLQYLMCPLQHAFYLGGGVGVLTDPELRKGLIPSYEWTIGYGWIRGDKKHIFLEANASVPFYGKGDIILPGISFGLGF